MEIISSIISSLTGLEIWIFSMEGKTMKHIPGNTDLSAIHSELDISTIKDLNHKTNDPALLYRDNYGLSYLHAKFLNGTMICGPFFEKGFSPPDNTKRHIAMQFLIPLLNQKEIQAIGQLIRLAGNQRGEKVLLEIPQAEAEPTHNPAHEDLNRMNMEIIDRSYEMERKIRSYASTGNTEGMREFLKTFSPTKTMIRRIPQNPLRQAKNGSVILNTILRLSAERGGLLPVHVHGISSEFSGRIERSKTLEELDNLRKEMCLTYCEAVHKFSLSNHSFIVRKTAEYILTHLDEKLSLSDLAKHVSCSPPYLARQFRKEYDMSVGEFIRSQKIEEAKYLLVNTKETLLEISVKLGFLDMGYFARIFKKMVGKPPSVYRDHMTAETKKSLPM